MWDWRKAVIVFILKPRSQPDNLGWRSGVFGTLLRSGRIVDTGRERSKGSRETRWMTLLKSSCEVGLLADVLTRKAITAPFSVLNLVNSSMFSPSRQGVETDWCTNGRNKVLTAPF